MFWLQIYFKLLPTMPCPFQLLQHIQCSSTPSPHLAGNSQEPATTLDEKNIRSALLNSIVLKKFGFQLLTGGMLYICSSSQSRTCVMFLHKLYPFFSHFKYCILFVCFVFFNLLPLKCAGKITFWGAMIWSIL